jgi:hypothetical protein
MNAEELIQQAIKDKIISFNEDKTRITYLLQNKIRHYKTEEIVQAEAYLKLIYEYNYPKETRDPKVTTRLLSLLYPPL